MTPEIWICTVENPIESVRKTIKKDTSKKKKKSSKVEPVISVDSTKETLPVPKKKRNLPLIYGGVGTLALGGGMLLYSHVLHNRFQKLDSSSTIEEVNSLYKDQRNLWFTGVGITLIGSGLTFSGSF